MEISELVWKLFLLLLPGIVTTLFVRYITTNKNYAPFYFIIYSAVFGIGVFVFLELIISVYNLLLALYTGEYNLQWGVNLSIWDSVLDTGKDFEKSELLIAYAIAIPFGLFIGYTLQHKILHRLLIKFNLTSRFADGDVWNFFLNNKNVEWIIVRDNKRNLAYYGSVRAYSEANDKREILMEDVDVYVNDTWEKLYFSNSIFLELDDNSFSLEEPEVEPEIEPEVVSIIDEI